MQACPGSGKTRALVAKLLSCIEDVRDTCRRVACITYTNAGVDEVEARVADQGSFGDELYCEISTIHAFCIRNILHPFHWRLDILRGGFEIVTPESDEWAERVSALCSSYGISPHDADRFDRVHRQADGTVFVPFEIPEDAGRDLVEGLERDGLVTFESAVSYSCQLVADAPDIARGLAARFEWVLIDEFQDTSPSQVSILEDIAAAGSSSFFLVGDPNQSIMSFTGADPELMPRFADGIGATPRLRLSGNYRSSQQVVERANCLIETDPPMLAVGPDRDSVTPVVHHHTSDANSGITELFLPALEEHGIAFGDAAILSPQWFHLYHLGRELASRGVRVVGPGARPYQRRREFAVLAENLCAFVAARDSNLFRLLQRSLFVTLLRLAGNPDYRVFCYEGRRTLLRLAKIAEERLEPGMPAFQWLEAVSERTASLLVEEEYLGRCEADVLVASVALMRRDVESKDIDPEAVAIEEMALFADPTDCLSLMTMHASKGREFDAGCDHRLA